MTKTTGIDIRKAIVGAGLRPSDFDEGAIQRYLNDDANGIDSSWVDEKYILDLAQHFKKE